MSSRLKLLAAIVPLLITGAAAARAEQPSPLASILPKGGLFGTTSSKGAAKPADVSGTPASNSSYWSEGGGLFGFSGVESAERCTDKLCNAYYGDAPSDETEPSPAQGSPETTADVTPVAPVAEAPALAQRDARPGCAASAQDASRDPWRCYR